MMKRKCVHIMGGLGNQLFQYAFARLLRKRLRIPVWIEVHSFKKDKLRDYRLNNYAVDIPAACGLEAGVSVLNSRLADRGLTLANTYAGKDAFSFVSMKEAAQYHFFYGYFQNTRYVDGIRDELQREIVYQGRFSERQKEVMREMERGNSVAVHVRRGDYLKLSGYRVVSREYYDKAIDWMKRAVPDAEFYIFSDEIGWCRDVFGKKGRFHYLDERYGSGDVTDFEMMRHCKNFVIGNSTFSWWASYLSENREKRCVAPGDWFTSEEANRRCRSALLDCYELI